MDRNKYISFIVLITFFLRIISAAIDKESSLYSLVKEIRSKTFAIGEVYLRSLWKNRDMLPQVWRFELPKAVINRDAYLMIIESPGYGTFAQFWSPDLNHYLHNIKIERFSYNGNTIEISAGITLNFTSDYLNLEITRGIERIPIKLEITGEKKEGIIKGKFKVISIPLPPLKEKEEPIPNPLPDSEGEFKLNYERPSVSVVPDPSWCMLRDNMSASVLYVTACFFEYLADEWYQKIRQIELIDKYNITPLKAVSICRNPAVSRPFIKFDKIEASGKKKKESTESLESILDLRDGDTFKEFWQEDRKRSTGKFSKESEEEKKAFKILQDILNRIELMHKFVSAWEQGDRSQAYYKTWVICHDPEFGPWYNDEFLPVDENGINHLPDSILETGEQRWNGVKSWKVLGPFPLTDLQFVTETLPDYIWCGNEGINVKKDELKDYSKGNINEWEECPLPGKYDFGFIVPPQWFSFNPYYRGMPPSLGYREYTNKGHYGLPDSTAYFRSIIKSPADIELWAGFGINQSGRIWINKRLLWQGPEHPSEFYHQQFGLLKIPFKKGENEILVRVDTDFSTPYFWLKLCTAGSPRTEEDVRIKEENVKKVYAALKRDSIVGWRGDGSGVFSGTHTPAVWDIKKKKNVLWVKWLPYFGNASPVPVPGSNKMFITLEPCWLICLDKDTGEELWRRSVTLLDILPEEEKKKGWELHEEWWKARQAVNNIPVYSTGRPDKWLEYQWYWAEGTGIWAPSSKRESIDTAKLPPELAALLEKKKELEEAPDPTVVQDELNKIEKEIEELQSKYFGSVPDSPQSLIDKLRKAESEYVNFLRKYSHVSGMGGGYWSDYCGWMFATPVTDGKYVWVKAGSDVAACFDLEGNKIWEVQTWGAGGADHTLCSPKLVDGKLILSLLNCDPDPAKRPRRGIKIVALNAMTGEKIWEVRDLPEPAWNDSTPVIMNLTDGKEVMKVLLTVNGLVIRIDDGKILCRDFGAQGGFDTPPVYNNISCFGHAALVPIEFIMKDRDRIGFRHLWAIRGGSHGVFEIGGALLIDGRILHAVWVGSFGKRRGEEISAYNVRVPTGTSESWKAIEAYSLKDGSYEFAIPVLRKGGHHWSPPCASEDYYYFIIGDHKFVNCGAKPPMNMVVLTREKFPLRLAQNAIDRTYGSGQIEGDRMYIRGYYSVVCIGYTGKDGETFEAITVARNLLDEIYWDYPADVPEREIPPRKSSSIMMYNYGTPRYRGKDSSHLILNGYAPLEWWILGPLPVGKGEYALKELGIFRGKILQGDETVNLDGIKYELGPIKQSYLKVPDFKSWELDPENFSDIHRFRRVIDIGKAINYKAPCELILMCELYSDTEQTIRYETGLNLKDIRTWIENIEIKNGDRLKTGKGYYQLVILLKVDSIPSEGLLLSPRFWISNNVKEEQSIWEREVKRRQRYFKKVIEIAPDSTEAKQASFILSKLN